MPSIALVLGAGGAVGAAFHAGVIAAVHASTGWDPRRADLIIGTSAGSGIAAALRSGLSPQDHLSRAMDEPLTPAGEALLEHLPADIRPPGFIRPGRLPLPASLGLLPASVLRREAPRPGIAVAGLLPRGTVSTELIGDAVRGMHPDPWPGTPTWICSVRLSDGSLVVFGRDEGPEPDLGLAVEASSAIPGFFQPVVVGEAEFVDGAVHSSTNADLAAGLGFDLVIVSAPMAAVPSALGRSVNAVGRVLHARHLRAEVEALRSSGTRTVVVQPTRADLHHMGLNAMDRERRGAVATQAYKSTLSKLSRPDMRDLIDSLEAAGLAD